MACDQRQPTRSSGWPSTRRRAHGRGTATHDLRELAAPVLASASRPTAAASPSPPADGRSDLYAARGRRRPAPAHERRVKDRARSSFPRATASCSTRTARASTRPGASPGRQRRHPAHAHGRERGHQPDRIARRHDNLPLPATRDVQLARFVSLRRTRPSRAPARSGRRRACSRTRRGRSTGESSAASSSTHRPNTIAIYDLDTKRYRDLGAEGSGGVTWLNGDRSLLFLRRGHLICLDVATQRVREVEVPAGTSGDARPMHRGRSPPACQDQRTMFVVRTRG